MRIQRMAVQIVAFVDDYQPGIVACEFTDAEGRKHRFVEKVPIVSSEALDKESAYPQPGAVRCEVLSEWRDVGGRDLARVSTARPDDVETAAGLSEFVVMSNLLSS